MKATQMEKITHREAANILGVGEWYLRERRNGEWANYPGLTRLQHRAGSAGRRGTRIWTFKEEVEALLNQLVAPKTFTPSESFPASRELIEMSLAAGAAGERALRSLGFRR
jgi:hypothetical protein